jgi:hypothetical protein
MANLDTCASTMCVPQRVRVGATFIACPGSGHSQADRSSGARLAPGSPDVFFIFSPAGDPFGECGITFVRGSGLRLASTPCANEIKQRPFLEEEQRAKHKMFSRLIWDVAKVAKGIRILLLTAVSCCRILLPPLPLRLRHRHLRCTLRLELRRTEHLLRIALTRALVLSLK